MDVDENLTSDDKVQVNKGKYDGQYGTITSITASSTRKNAVLTYIVQLLGDAFPEPVPFVSKDLKKVEAFPQQHPADLDDPSPVPTAKKRKTLGRQWILIGVIPDAVGVLIIQLCILKCLVTATMMVK